MSTQPIQNLNLNAFQMAWAEARSKRDDFDFFVHTHGMKASDRKQGPIVLPYYTKDGVMRCARLGLNRVLCEV